MSEQDKKRLLREAKRQIKKDGNRSRRRYLKKQLEENPETAHLDDYDYKFDTSTHLNGMDNDLTRKKVSYCACCGHSRNSDGICYHSHECSFTMDNIKDFIEDKDDYSSDEDKKR